MNVLPGEAGDCTLKAQLSHTDRRDVGARMKLRPYQEEAVQNIERELGEVDSTIAVLATGLGKTVLFADVCRRFVDRGERALVLAHRKELVEQAADKIEKVTGLRAGVEQAERKEGRDGAPIVVGSVQSMVRRLGQFEPDAFGLVVSDECHTAVSKTNVDVTTHFTGGGAKHLGVTATPTRGDKVALGQLYDSVAYEYEIVDAIPDGWLVPVQQQTIQTSIDFSEIRTTAGDFNQGDLSEVMSDPQALYEICGPTVELAEDRPALVFAVTVAHAHALAEAMQDLTKAEVAVLDGKTHPDERKRVVEAYKAGHIQFLVNCQLFVLGFDAPPTALVAMASPTKSSLRWKQMLGRGTRPLDGVVDPFATGSAKLRRDAIAASAKPDLLVLDFAGNAGRHNLCSAANILDGVATAPELAIVKSILAEDTRMDVLEAFRLAKAQLSAMELKRMREQARRHFKSMRVDPFLAMGVDKSPDPYAREMSVRQREVLENCGVPVEGVDMTQASRLIGNIIERRQGSRATYKQAQLLVKRGLHPEKVMGISFDQASALIDRLAKNKWREPVGWGANLK